MRTKGSATELEARQRNLRYRYCTVGQDHAADGVAAARDRADWYMRSRKS
jgi:hypothetical protein